MLRLIKPVFVIALIGSVVASPAQAQISPGVTQSAAHTATITGTITQSNGTPVGGADVKIKGPAILSTKSDDHGMFTFTSVPWGTYHIIVTSPLGLASLDNIVVNGDTNVSVRYEGQLSEMRAIAHVSTSSAGASINVTPASIASVNPSDYAFQGNASWKELLQQIPGVTVGGNLDAGGAAAAIIPGSPFEPIVLSINGALPYETSTTLDGMPLVNNSFNTGSSGVGAGTDLAFLPMPMFDTADVVRGPGANAPSIVDSIGGSFVLHPPGDVLSNHFEFSASNDPYGGIVSNMKGALRVGRLSATFVYGINDSPGPLGKREVISAYAATPLTINGQTFQGCGSSGCSSFAPNPQYMNCDCQLANQLLYCCVAVNTAWAQHSGAMAITYDLAPSVTAQIFYAGSSSEMQEPGWQDLVDFTPGTAYGGSISPGAYRYFYVPLADSITESSSLLEEKVTAYFARGVLRVAAVQNRSFSEQDNLTSGTPTNGVYNLWGTGYVGATAPGTLVAFNGSPQTLTFAPSSLNLQYNADNRDLLLNYAAQLGPDISADASYVTSYYNAPYSYEYFGSFSFSGGQPSAVSQATNETRIHFGVNLPPKVLLDASWYFAQATYHVQSPLDLTGNTYTNSVFQYNAPRLGIVWRTSSDVAIRAAAGGGYALPPLDDLVGTDFPAFCITYCSQTVTNLNLRPEQSFGIDIGADARMQRGTTTVSFDIYRTNLYGQLFQSTSLTGTFGGLPLYTTQYDNLSASRYEGINIEAQHGPSTGIYWLGSIGLTRAYVVNVPPGFYNGLNASGAPCTDCVNQYIIPGINSNGEFQSTVPYAVATADAGYRWAPGKSIDLAPTYFGKGNPYFQPAFVELDAHASYAFTKNLYLFATLRNVTGIYDENYAFQYPTLGAPAIAGLPYPLFGLPYGPRSAIVTINARY